MILFTQYQMPYGEPRLISIDRPLEVEAAAQKLIEAGCVFEIEVLRTGEVSMTCETEDGVVAIEICANGPEVPGRVDSLVMSASRIEGLI